MHRRPALAAVLLGGVALTAQVVRTPDSAAGPPPRPWRVGVAVTGWLPQGDGPDYADRSPGLRPAVAFAVTPVVAITADGDYVFVDRADDLRAGDIYYYAVSLGVRLTLPGRARLKPTLGLALGRYAVHVECDPADCGGALVHDDVIAPRGELGATFAVTPRLEASASVGYTHGEYDVGFLTPAYADLDAVIVALGLSARL